MEKLDPNLLRILESTGARERQRSVQVIVGLSAPASDADLRALEALGLSVRSALGDVLTGSAHLADIPRIAEHALILTIEASTPLYPE